MHQIPWKRVAVIKGMTVSPGTAFSGPLQPGERPCLGAGTAPLPPKHHGAKQSLSEGKLG